MGEKTKFIAVKEKKHRYDAAIALRQLANQIIAGELSMGESDGKLSVPTQVKLEIEIEEKSKSKGKKYEVEVELSWEEEGCACGK